MRFQITTLAAIAAMLVLTTDAMAYSETPFVNAKKGDTMTCKGWVIATGEKSHPYLVVVTSGCKSGHSAFFATGGENVVAPDQLGRPIMVTAKVVEKPNDSTNPLFIRLEILRVRSADK